jgi:hypothetical protein
MEKTPCFLVKVHLSFKENLLTLSRLWRKQGHLKSR